MIRMGTTVTEGTPAKPLGTMIFRYLVVGLANTAVHFLVTILLVEAFRADAVIASAVGFIFALLVAFILNSRWTFGRRDKPVVRLWRYSVVSISGLCLNLLIMYLAVDYLGLHYLFGLAAVVLVVTPWNFALNLFWSFAERGTSRSG